MSDETGTPTKRPKDRREFLLGSASTAGACAIGYQGAAALRALVPNVSV